MFVFFFFFHAKTNTSSATLHTLGRKYNPHCKLKDTTFPFSILNIAIYLHGTFVLTFSLSFFVSLFRQNALKKKKNMRYNINYISIARLNFPVQFSYSSFGKLTSQGKEYEKVQIIYIQLQHFVAHATCITILFIYLHTIHARWNFYYLNDKQHYYIALSL